MKRFIYILFCALSLNAYASYFEVQVPMTEQQQVQVIGHRTIATGHFSTTVNSLSSGGIAYAPGQTPGTSLSSGPHRAKKVEDEDYEDDPFMGNFVPLGSTPWVLFLLLILAYGGVKIRNQRKKASL